MVGQPHQNFMKMASWSRVSEHLVNLIGMSDQLKWNNQLETMSLILWKEPKNYGRKIQSETVPAANGSGISLNTISKQYHISKHTSSKVKRRKEELEFDTAKLECYSDTELGKLFFPNLYESEDIYAPIDNMKWRGGNKKSNSP